MELNPRALTKASVVVVALAYIFCTVFVILFPDLAAMLVGYLMHSVNIDTSDVTLQGFITGIIQIIVYTVLTTWLFAVLYNRFLNK